MAYVASDASIGATKETTWGTYAAPTRWFEFKSETLDLVKNVKQGVGLRATGTALARSGRRFIPTTTVAGDVEFEVTSRQFGNLFENAIGFGTPTLIPTKTTAYQQVFTLPTSANSVIQPPGLTIQKGVMPVGASAPLAFTFLGMTCTDWEFNLPENDLLSLKMSLAGKAYNNNATTALVTPSYAANMGTAFHSGMATVQVGGTITAPTTTALASMTSPLASLNVVDFNLKGSNSLNTTRYVLSASGSSATISQPTYGLRSLSGSMTVEFDATSDIVGKFQNDTAVPIIVTLQGSATNGGDLIDTGSYGAIQFVISDARFNSELSKVSGTDIVQMKIEFDVLDNLTATQPFWLVYQTNAASAVL